MVEAAGIEPLALLSRCRFLLDTRQHGTIYFSTPINTPKTFVDVEKLNSFCILSLALPIA